MGIFTQVYLDNPLWVWLLSVLISLILWGGLILLKKIVISRFSRLAGRTKTAIDDALVASLQQTKALFLFLLAVFIGSLVLTLNPHVAEIMRDVFMVGLFIQAALWGNAILSFWISEKVRKKKDEDPASTTAMAVITFFAKIVLWSVFILLALQNLGVDITAAIAGMGIGGIAIALATQSILSDLFCSVAIVLDRPFEVGDFVIVGDLLGVVERIGIKTTRIRSLHGEQIVFTNADLIGSRVRNYKRMAERRVLFGFGVVYQTPADKLEKIPLIVGEIIEKLDLARFDRAHFKDFGDFSLNFEVVYYVKTGDYNQYMDVQEQINLAIYRQLEKEGIEFAYPTQTLYVNKEVKA